MLSCPLHRHSHHSQLTELPLHTPPPCHLRSLQLSPNCAAGDCRHKTMWCRTKGVHYHFGFCQQRKKFLPRLKMHNPRRSPSLSLSLWKLPYLRLKIRSWETKPSHSSSTTMDPSRRVKQPGAGVPSMKQQLSSVPCLPSMTMRQAVDKKLAAGMAWIEGLLLSDRIAGFDDSI